MTNTQRRRLFKKNTVKNTDPEKYVEGKKYPGHNDSDPYGYSGYCPRCGVPVETNHPDMIAYSDEHTRVFRCPKCKRLFV
ncbi:MAG: hypothetical protein IJ709_10175 [Selenomonas sp.]|nr:hypothetical protein [Selenomonas sp.]